MHKRTKALDIPKKVKDIVFERDKGCCIFCGNPGMPNAHYIPRSKSGLGIEQNIVTACISCHSRMDNSHERYKFLQLAKEYLWLQYPDFSDERRIYKK